MRCCRARGRCATARFPEVWRDEYTPFRLREVLEKFDAEFQYWWKLQMRIRAIAQRYRNGETLPLLESATAGAPVE